MKGTPNQERDIEHPHSVSHASKDTPLHITPTTKCVPRKCNGERSSKPQSPPNLGPGISRKGWMDGWKSMLF
ncbi:hypothetical protein CHARACLAT_023048 [Characodon lateralis]|uniref:Uncharacterized protein n=1 Tax=Characodon lateralis TaxID=208331 RepID=A0ABU7DJ52_9TELE|nr:hypothetical protein [Characodon lateralis]